MPRVTDGQEWVEVTEEEAAQLACDGVAVFCDSLNCPTGTMHPMHNMALVERKLKDIRG